MRNRRLVALLAVVSFLTNFASALADEPLPLQKKQKPMLLTGLITKDQAHDGLGFDLTAGDEILKYELKGGSSTDKGWLRSDVEFSYISVLKRSLLEGKTYVEEFENDAIVKFYFRKRQVLPGSQLAGIAIEGECISGALNQGQFLKGLTVDGVSSTGVLDYLVINGHYEAKNGCRFGNCAIGSTLPNSRCALNFDKYPYLSQAIQVHMTFGNLALNGRITIDDAMNHDEISLKIKQLPGVKIDLLPNGSSEARVNIKLTRRDGSRPVFAQPNEKPTSDDREMRLLLAWFQLMAYDIYGL